MRRRGDRGAHSPEVNRLMRAGAVSVIILTTAALTIGVSSAMDHGAAATVVSSPPRQGPKTVDGVPLVPISATQRGECQKFANQLRRRVPCPGLLPDPIAVTTVPAGGPCLGVIGEDACGEAVIEVSNFQVPPGCVGVSIQQYNGAVVPMTSIAGGPLGHFVFMAGTDLPPRLWNQTAKGRCSGTCVLFTRDDLTDASSSWSGRQVLPMLGRIEQ